MNNQFYLYAYELADLYALLTLYDHLKIEAPDLDPTIIGSVDYSRAEYILGDRKSDRTRDSNCFIVNTHSDCSGGEGEYHLDVDITLLKNSALPMSKDEKMELREKYDVPSDKPVVTIGFASNRPVLSRLAYQLHQDAHVILVGSSGLDCFSTQNRKADKEIQLVKQWGVLKDFYALADVALSGHNVMPTLNYLHNFVEATEGGPLFLVPPNRVHQYGYKQLVRTGVIREADRLDDLIRKVKRFVQNFEGNEEHVRKRSEHIMRTRETYLPIITDFIRYMMSDDMVPPARGDLFVLDDNEHGIRLQHPETHWDIPDKYYSWLKKMRAKHVGPYLIKKPMRPEERLVKINQGLKKEGFLDLSIPEQEEKENLLEYVSSLVRCQERMGGRYEAHLW